MGNLKGGDKMNGMMALMPMLNMTKLTNETDQKLISVDGEGKDGFMQALKLIMGGSQEESVDISSDELIKKLELHDEWVALILNSSLEELAALVEEPLEKLSELIKELPLDEGFLSEDLLDIKEIQQLLDVLPEEWSEEIKTLIENNTSLEGLLEEFKTSGDPVQLLALITSLTANEHHFADKKMSETVQLAVQKIMHSFFPKFSQEEKTQPIQQTLSQFLNFLPSGEKSSSIEKQVVIKGQSFNTSRFVELAFVNQLASENSQPKSSQTLPSTMMLDTTNSQIARFQTMVLPSGDSPPERPTQEQFIRQFQNLLSRSSFQQLANGTQQLNLKLHPASLGRMDITIQQVNGVMMASIMTTTKVARELMDGQLSQLRNAFLLQNIPIDKIEVTQQQNQQLLKDPNHDDSKKHKESQHNEASDKEEEEEQLDFADFLATTINTEA
jgi:flagellar hook-length control protein FliK